MGRAAVLSRGTEGTSNATSRPDIAVYEDRGSLKSSVKKPFRPIDRSSKVSVLQDHTVHVIDDDEAVCQALGVVLGGAGYAFRLHSSAAAFLAWTRR